MTIDRGDHVLEDVAWAHCDTPRQCCQGGAEVIREPLRDSERRSTLSLENRLDTLDVELFAGIDSETKPADRTALLALQRCIRAANDGYAYLEIGSHLGGSLQTHYADVRCRRVYSIDRRPAVQPDERGISIEYPANSTQKMRECLRRAWPQADAGKLMTFDCDARHVPLGDIEQTPRLCFIDGEHTHDAVYSDFQFCFDVCDDNAVIAFHDAGVVHAGIERIERYLTEDQVPFVGLKLGGSVYAILLREAVDDYRDELRSLTIDADQYFRRAHRWQRFVCAANRLGCRRLYLWLWKIRSAARQREKRS